MCDPATAASSRRASSSTPSFGGVRVAGGGNEGAGSGGSGSGTWSAVPGINIGISESFFGGMAGAFALHVDRPNSKLT